MMALRGGAHVVGHAAEKGLLGRLILAGDLQGVLQQLALSELLLFLIHFPQGENHFFRRKGFVIEDAGVDPAVVLPEPAQEITTEVPGLLFDQTADIFGGEVFQKFLIGVGFDDISGQLQQIGIRSGTGNVRVRGAFDQLIGVLLEIDPVEGVVGVAQGLDRLIGTLHAGVDLHVPPGHPQQSQEEDRDDGNKEQAQPVEAAQDVRIGDRDNRDPAVIHPGVGNGPKVSVLICDGVGIIVQFPRIDLLDDGVEVVLHIFLRLRHVGLLVDDGACAVAQEKGILIELLGRIELEMKIFRENIEGQNGVPVSALLSRRDDRLVVDGVRVDVGENHLASGLARFLIPFRGGDIIGVVAVPGVGGQDLSIQDQVGIHDPLSKDRLHPLKVEIQPGDQILPGRFAGKAVADGGGAEGEKRLVDGKVALPLGCIDLRQGGPGFLGVFQQGGADQGQAQDCQNDQQAQRDEVEPHAPQNTAQPGPALPPDLGAHCAKTSRTAAVTWS